MDITITVDSEELLTHDAWRFLVAHRADYLCERCGDDGSVAHHCDRDKLNHRLANGECLCHRCHRIEHAPEIHAGLLATYKPGGRAYEARQPGGDIYEHRKRMGAYA